MARLPSQPATARTIRRLAFCSSLAVFTLLSCGGGSDPTTEAASNSPSGPTSITDVTDASGGNGSSGSPTADASEPSAADPVVATDPPTETEADPPVDTDLDGVPDDIDNCDDVDNLDQADDNGNGVGTACDLTETTVAPTSDGCGDGDPKTELWRMVQPEGIDEDVVDGEVIAVPSCGQPTPRRLPPGWGKPIGQFGDYHLFVVSDEDAGRDDLGLPPGALAEGATIESSETIDGEGIVGILTALAEAGRESSLVISTIVKPEAKDLFPPLTWQRFVDLNPLLVQKSVVIETPAASSTSTSTSP